MSTFIFEEYSFSAQTGEASFKYSFDGERFFEEKILFSAFEKYNAQLLDKALFLSFILIGTSYYKTFPTQSVRCRRGGFDAWQVKFFSTVYQEGMSQFAYENTLRRSDLAHFKATVEQGVGSIAHNGDGVLALQSGGKDSLLTASLLAENNTLFTPWYITSSDHHPAVLDTLGEPLVTVHRQLDHAALKRAEIDGGKNGHVPVTYIVQSLAIVQAILLGKNTILTSIAHEGEEPHEWIEDLPVNHQWSKTWPAEELFVEYVQRYISPDIAIGSALRGYSEMRVAELFAEKAWEKFGHSFSSCNLGNYMQGADNTQLTWCGNCPKCANSYLLFAPFIEADELNSLFAGQDLFAKPELIDTFKGLLGIDGVMKPFECIGEVDELRLAYHTSQKRPGYNALPFTVLESHFDYIFEYPRQDKFTKYL